MLKLTTKISPQETPVINDKEYYYCICQRVLLNYKMYNFIWISNKYD